MSPPEVWGPPVWNLFHSISCQLNNVELIKPIFVYIQRICRYLPCPECSTDATDFLRKVRLGDVKTVDDLSMALYLFHNHVNKKKKKALYNYSDMSKYKSHNLIVVYNNFVRVYNTRGNMKMISEDFQRNMIIADFKKWLGANIMSFTPT
jgi:hypothetical protein